MKLNENTNVAMPIKNMVGIIIAVAMGIFAYTEITARLTSLETSRELMNADLLKASEQTTVDKDGKFKIISESIPAFVKNKEEAKVVSGDTKGFITPSTTNAYRKKGRRGGKRARRKNAVRS